MPKQLSYAEALAKDRDKYLRQRNRLMKVLRPILSAYGSERTNHDAPILKDAQKALEEIEGKPVDAPIPDQGPDYASGIDGHWPS